MRRPGAYNLGSLVGEYIKHRVLPLEGRGALAADAWSDLVPATLREHCTLDGISAGRLKVMVDSPVYLYQIKLCSRELLEQLQRQCPRAQIKNIEFVVGSVAANCESNRNERS